MTMLKRFTAISLIVGFAFAFTAAAAPQTYSVLNYFAQTVAGGDNVLNIGGTWKIGGTAVTATAANLNAIPTATGSGAVIDAMTKNYCTSPTIALSASTATQTATITCKDADGATIAAVQALTVYIADDVTGATVSTVGANGTVTFTTGSIVKSDTAKLVFRVVTDVNGVAVLSIGNTGGTDHYAHYVVVQKPGGKITVSAVTDVRSS